LSSGYRRAGPRRLPEPFAGSLRGRGPSFRGCYAVEAAVAVVRACTERTSGDPCGRIPHQLLPAVRGLSLGTARGPRRPPARGPP